MGEGEGHAWIHPVELGEGHVGHVSGEQAQWEWITDTRRCEDVVHLGALVGDAEQVDVV